MPRVLIWNAPAEAAPSRFLHCAGIPAQVRGAGGGRGQGAGGRGGKQRSREESRGAGRKAGEQGIS